MSYNNEKQNVIQLDFSEEMKNAYRDYAMSVIISRALPDVRDGLKPVQRRILYSMNELGLSPDKPHRKSARIVGDTMGKYHPHGDSSIYDALVHMSQDYSLSIPLVDGHGNFGSIDGDGAAAMRYTEARLSEGATALLSNLDKNLVEFMPNFDNSEKEPTVLPSTIPNLLINGTTGIAVGMATNIPPHNPSEVIDGVIACIDKPNISIEKLMEYIKGPDFPTGGTVINRSQLQAIYEKGEGKIKLRAKTQIEKSDHGRKKIVVTQIPYTAAGNKTKLVENLATLMKEKVFEEIYDVRDESSKEGIRIVIEVKKDRDLNNLLNGLYKKTGLEDTYSVNLLAVKEKQPITFNLKTIIQEFIDFQIDLYTKEYTYMLKKATNRLEVVDGLIKATDLIDLIIEILRGSKTIKQAKDCLINGNVADIKFKSSSSKKKASKLNFSQAQADAILAMPLSRLVGLELEKLVKERDELEKNIISYQTILSKENELLKVIKNRLRKLKKQFARPRRTLLDDIENIDYKEDIKIEDLYILIDRFGYTKSIDMTAFSRISKDTLKDYVHIIKIKNTDKLCVFSSGGNMYQIKVMNIPKCKVREKGVLIQNLCKSKREDLLLYLPYEKLLTQTILFTSKNGLIKQVDGQEFVTTRSTLVATKLDNNDNLVAVYAYDKDLDITNKKVLIVTNAFLALTFKLEEVSTLKRISKGVKAIELNSSDYVKISQILDVGAKSFEYEDKKYSIEKIRIRKRGNRGQNIKPFSK